MWLMIINTLAPLILLIASGQILHHKQILSDDFWKNAEKLNYYFLFPVLLFLNLAYANIDFQQSIPVLKALFSISIAIYIFLLICKSILKIPTCNFGVYVQANLRFNTYVGLAVISSVLGEQGSVLFAVIMALFIPFVNVISVLSFVSKDELSFRYLAKMILTNPLIVSCFLGLAFNVLDLKLWTAIEQFFRLLANCSLPLGLLCIGAVLGFKGQTIHYPSFILNSVAKLTIFPFLAYLTGLYYQLNDLELSVLVLFCALPCASAAYTLTRVLNGNEQLMANIITLQTVLSALSLAGILAWINYF